MKFLFIAWLAAATQGVAQGVAWDSLAHQNTVPASARISFGQLAQGTLSDLDQGSKELGDTPGIALALMELLEKVYRDSDDYRHVYTVLNIIVQRRDLAEIEQGILRNKLEEIWNQPGNANSVVLKDCGLRIIANYPGEVNEDLLLKYLKEPKSLEVVGFQLNAMEGLEKIGTKRSLKTLQAYLVQQHHEKDTHRKQARKAVEAITARIKLPASGATARSATGGSGALNPSKPPEQH